MTVSEINIQFFLNIYSTSSTLNYMNKINHPNLSEELTSKFNTSLVQPLSKISLMS